MTEFSAKVLARSRIAQLVHNFKRNEADCLRATYNETQARTDFITPLLEALGWDVHNTAGHPVALREVIEEATVDVGDERLSKKPDYELRLARQRKLFVEAKKPSVKIDRNRDAAFQTRRYGFSASLPISILTNFHQLAIYDCSSVPTQTDEAHVARLLLIRYEEFEERFDELWSMLSRQAVYSGEFDRKFITNVKINGAEQFDEFFLRQVRSWRERLATDIHANTPGLSPSELTYAVQLFLSRIVFLRICEDREIERYATLKNLPAINTFNAFMIELRRADDFYDSGIFRLIDDAKLGIRVSDSALYNIIAELYYPKSPYTFAVVETEVLGGIYEQFLGEEIVVIDGKIKILYKPEVRESGGVVSTPRYIVDAVVERTLLPLLSHKSPTELVDFVVIDICCGSGIFLLSVYEFILDYYLMWYLSNNRENHIGKTIYEVGVNNWRLTFDEKRRILQTHIRGVDIDANAIEVAQLSLLLKLIEDETGDGLREYVKRERTSALPDLDKAIRSGNSLVSQTEWAIAMHRSMLPTLVEKVNPFNWYTEFPVEMKNGGFNVIVANPPYIRIQNMNNYSPEEVAFYQSKTSPYLTARQDNFDKYALFIERALTLLRPDGRLGVIIPHKFMNTQAGRALRRLITANHLLKDVVHFGVKQVFGKSAANYTCILILDRCGSDEVRVEQVMQLDAWRYGEPGEIMIIPASVMGEDNWQFADAETRALFDRICKAFPQRLGQVAEIFVGVQTSADRIYIFRSINETDNIITLHWDGRDWPIERGILRPCLNKVQLSSYSRPKPNAWMIFPYVSRCIERHIRALPIAKNEMIRSFPGCMAYLNARREELLDRNFSTDTSYEREFYEFGRSQSLTKFNSPKIILPALSLEARYAYDDTNIIVTGGGNGPYYLVRQHEHSDVSNHFLLAVLNHPLSEAFIRINTSTFRGGYYSHGKQYIENLPIPLANSVERQVIETLVKQVIEILTSATVARVPHQITILERQAIDLQAQIETHITGLFGLSVDDMNIIESVQISA